MGRGCNIGIIGVGRWGINYLRTLKELNANVSWICATKENTLKEALSKTKTKTVKTTTNYRDVLEDTRVDAVAIATPGSTHHELTKQALLSSKHVLVEKPLAFCSRDAEELVRISKENSKILMVGHLHRFNAAIKRIKEDIQAGLFGKINYVHSFGFGNGPIRNDMSALWDFFPHDVSILLYLLAEYPLIVSANGASYISKGVEDVVTMDVKFPNDVFAAVIGSWMYPVKKRGLIIVGEKLCATFDDYATNEKLKYYGRKLKSIKGNIVIEDKRYHVPNIEDARPLTEQLKHFLDCVENNKTPLTDGHEALKVVKILECAQKSLKQNGLVVEVPP